MEDGFSPPGTPPGSVLITVETFQSLGPDSGTSLLPHGLRETPGCEGGLPGGPPTTWSPVGGGCGCSMGDPAGNTVTSLSTPASQ
jgi:hypothetical protein